jgi:hypothetical protein
VQEQVDGRFEGDALAVDGDTVPTGVGSGTEGGDDTTVDLHPTGEDDFLGGPA